MSTETEARPHFRTKLLPPLLKPPRAPIRPRARPPAGSGRLCDGCTAAPNLQRRQWGAFCGSHSIPRTRRAWVTQSALLVGWTLTGAFFLSFFPFLPLPSLVLSCGDRGSSIHLVLYLVSCVSVSASLVLLLARERGTL